ncbi:MAG: TetR/AcrR family transcriptional regulator [Hymenobacter sp.]|nr:MAG: TetR/AcrR family transcriptional regulator [Hymenobacter sp.]
MIANKSTILLEAALTCFVECGLHGTTTADVAARAEVGPATLFRSFASKDILMEATYTYAIAQLAVPLTEEESAAKPGERLHDLLARWWNLTAEAALNNPVAFRYWCLYRVTPRPNALEVNAGELGPFIGVPMLLERAVGKAPWLTISALPVQLIGPLLAAQWTATLEVALARAADPADTSVRTELLSRTYKNWWITVGLPAHTLVTGNVLPVVKLPKPTPALDALIKKYVPNFKQDD